MTLTNQTNQQQQQNRYKESLAIISVNIQCINDNDKEKPKKHLDSEMMWTKLWKCGHSGLNLVVSIRLWKTGMWFET